MNGAERSALSLRLRYLAAWRLGETRRAMELYEELRRLEAGDRQDQDEASVDASVPMANL
ncbi:hypothetical protein [Streptomyces sp. UNOC14_S4]|uniref:hypothetical protein n=1 Tax=Streptomyces sp. UNOC14_S4 TaxID=2872340 RepID=UPI001E4A3767|nr:hypothetical protein [Streptomyces sp. UNOC14_S4]MCC3768784.1 hypothetical protein [Streptomyces sp. UNOC14_S4]